MGKYSNSISFFNFQPNFKFLSHLYSQIITRCESMLFLKSVSLVSETLTWNSCKIWQLWFIN